MNIGLQDVDFRGFPNLALMKISSFHKANGDNVEWVFHFYHYDKIYKSKIFTFSPDDDTYYDADEIIKGGTGYDVKSKLPDEIERAQPDYSIYPKCNYSIQFYSRGCIRHCPFCVVHDKECYIQPAEPMKLNPRGKWIEVLDNNFFANPEWRDAVKHLKRCNQPANFHGVDVRIMDTEQAEAINSLRLKNAVHVAWDLPQLDLTEQLRTMAEIVKRHKITCYVLIGYNSTPEQDLYRLRTIKKLGIAPFVQPYRDFENKRKPTQYEKDLAHWANRRWIFKTCDFMDFKPRQGFKCSKYFES